MAAPTASEVKELFIGGTEAADAAIDFYAECADDLVTERLDASEFSTARIDRITRLVAAHFLAASEPTVVTEAGMNARRVYETPSFTDVDLGETRYGRRAIQLDQTGALSQAGEEKATFSAFGPINTDG